MRLFSFDKFIITKKLLKSCFLFSNALLLLFYPLPLHPDSLPHLPDHLLQQRLHFLAGLGVDGVQFAFTLGVGGGVAAFVEVVVDLVDAAGAGFADFAGVGGEFGGVGLGDGGRFGRFDD